MRDGTHTHAWTRASAALPLKWRLMGVVLDPQGAETPLPGDLWVAWAKGPKDGDEAAGAGQTPEAALYRLAERRGSMGG